MCSARHGTNHDKHVKIKKKLPWLNSNIKNGISERCKLEREWKKDLDDTNKFMTPLDQLKS